MQTDMSISRRDSQQVFCAEHSSGCSTIFAGMMKMSQVPKIHADSLEGPEQLLLLLPPALAQMVDREIQWHEQRLEL